MKSFSLTQLLHFFYKVTHVQLSSSWRSFFHLVQVEWAREKNYCWKQNEFQRQFFIMNEFLIHLRMRKKSFLLPSNWSRVCNTRQGYWRITCIINFVVVVAVASKLDIFFRVLKSIIWFFSSRKKSTIERICWEFFSWM